MDDSFSYYPVSEMVKLGPKEMKGTIWDHKQSIAIDQILISHEHDVINSLQFIYCLDDDVIPSEILGKPCGSKFNTVTFVLNEFLTSLSGEYENGRLVSIVFGTNKTTHGPFGRTARSSSLSNDDFSFQFGPRDCFGGFHGSVDNGCGHSIGVYVKPFEFSFDEMKRRI